ncbi:family 43 glycosylhydrolase [Geodermatophilus sp. URMC 60]
MNSNEPSMTSAGGRVSHEQRVLVGNPIVTEAYTSDPAVLVQDETVYLYTGHDEAPPDGQTYEMNDWLGFSSDDLLTWRSHGPLLAVDSFEWATGGAKAGTVTERDGRFFWYVAVDHSTTRPSTAAPSAWPSPTAPPARSSTPSARHSSPTTCRSRPTSTTRSIRP